MVNPLVCKLRGYVHLSDVDQMRLADALGPGRAVAAHADIIGQGEDPHTVKVIMEGWACRYRQLNNGGRQIVSLLLPGDMCDPHVFLLDRMDHAISTITPVVLAQMHGPTLKALTARSPMVEQALHREALATAAIQREWTVSLGRRSGIERMAHLFCELYARQKAIGLADQLTCQMPLTQLELGDALGQTSVHINRTLQELRSMGLITLRSRSLIILDWDGLAKLADFDPVYLHLTEAEAA